MIPCCIFSYSEHSYETVLAARSALAAGYFPVFVIEQHDKPLCPVAVRALENENAIVMQTTFPRGKNLNGIDCILGMHRVFLSIMDRCQTDSVFKLDADTLVLSNRMVTAASGSSVFGWNSGKRPLYGAAYLVSRALSEFILKFTARWKGIPGMDNGGVQEDKALIWMAALRDESSITISPYDPKGGFGSFWAFQDPESHFPVYMERYEVVNFGNRRDPDGRAVSKVEAYLTMQSFFEHFQKCRTNHSSCGSPRAA